MAPLPPTSLSKEKASRRRRFNIDPKNVVSSDEGLDNFHDVEDKWELEEGLGKVGVHKKLISLLEDIDKLLEREIKEPCYSSDEERHFLTL